MASKLMRASVACVALAFTALVGTTPPASSADTLEKLEAQSLEKGQCGLFLWARSTDQTFVVVAYDQPSIVRVRIDGRERQLPRTTFSGEPVFGHFESQTFSAGGLTVGIDIEFDADKPVRDGALVKRGLVRYGRQGEPETIMPVGGIAACKRS
jgi:hypothetical protein